MPETLIVKKFLPVSREKVFEALTDPAIMSKWFFPDPAWSARVENQLKIGGHYKIAMDNGQDQVHDSSGVYRTIEKPALLEFTWNAAMQSGDVKDSIVSIRLESRDEGTELTLTHSEFPTDQAKNSHEKGWNGCLATLESRIKEF